MDTDPGLLHLRLGISENVIRSRTSPKPGSSSGAARLEKCVGFLCGRKRRQRKAPRGTPACVLCYPVTPFSYSADLLLLTFSKIAAEKEKPIPVPVIIV